MLKFCTRHGLRYAPAGVKKSHWTKAHRAWLEQLRTSEGVTAEERTVISEYLSLLAYTEQRRDALDRQLEDLVLAPAVSAAVATLSVFRGIDFHAALVLATEIRDWRRFTKATQTMAYVGLVPREDSSAVEHRGAITKMGNAHARHVLVQAAWRIAIPRGLAARSKPGKTARIRA